MAIDRSVTSLALVRSNFFGKDFDTICQEIIDTLEALSTTETANNFVASDEGIMLIEAMSFAMATQNWYGDRQAGETTLDLEEGARIRDNVVAIARQLGYKPFGAVPAVVTLTVSISPAAPIQFTIPKGTSLVEESGLPYETAEDLTFLATETGPKTVLARQGEGFEELFTSDGEANQRFFLETVPSTSTIAQGTVECRIDSVLWQEVPLLEPRSNLINTLLPGTLTFAASNVVLTSQDVTSIVRTGDLVEDLDGNYNEVASVTSTQIILNLIYGGTVGVSGDGVLNRRRLTANNIYEVSLGTNPPFVRTGDNIFGNVPEVDVEVRVSYFTTFGPNGSVASEAVNGFVDPIFAGVTLITPTVTHVDPSTPGSFRETLSSIKFNAPLVFQAGKRAVTILDLDGLINGFVDATWGAVVKGRATTPRSAAADARLQTHLATLRNSDCFSEAEIIDLETYWNKVVSSECQANIVMAQILSEDGIGRYVSSPVGLARALEAYLDGLLESTVKSWAVDGTVNLFSVDMSAEIKVLDSRDTDVLRAEIIAEVDQIIQGFLLGRDFGVSLRIGDLYALVEDVDAVEFSNLRASLVQNQGDDVTATKVDDFGNVVVDTFEVITLGALPTVTIIEA